MSSIRWSFAALGCFVIALLAVLAANVPPGRNAPTLCFIIAGVAALIGVFFRIRALKDLRQAYRERGQQQ
ncbi:hypothetical protein [Enemella evansiae]|uniref:hypothetical protein n=1 Tax=Enemella evansiae TaxID=2016499 RepID=UPI000B96D1EF|nr:hypothetical protein [Enemella evansiae]OYN95400.1 hypothetical protein CGZ95_16890 [Enemella evansiae]OYO03508.1 hypothetical protein CGZ97_08670 [Enemella evansiae]